MPIPGNLLTTAMTVMPHVNVDRALEKALSLDIPFCRSSPTTAITKTCMFRLPSIFRAFFLTSKQNDSLWRFLDRGGIRVWGIVPTGFENFEKDNIPSLMDS